MDGREDAQPEPRFQRNSHLFNNKGEAWAVKTTDVDLSPATRALVC
jgi:hypothetical protein